ncbi:MAG: hypothetical protein JWO11_3961 [Nocardioides sp.]|nr:hypothetical protein [Nocardioides sp.]
MKFRRKSSDQDLTSEVPGADEAEEQARGPLDAEDLPDDGIERVDLGSLLIEPEPGRELRLQVDEQSGEVQAVVLAGPDGALELRAFAAPRNGDLWSDSKRQMAAEISQRGGTATEREGRFGTELVCQMPVSRPDGTAATQPSRIIGINGPRWFLRANLLGRPAMDLEGSGEWEDTIAKVAVRRGEGAVPPGEPLPVVLPENARRVDPPTA